MMRFNGLARGCATARFAGGCRAISEFAGAPPTGAGLPSTSPVRAAAKPGRGPYHIEGMPFPKIRHESFPQYKESIFWDAKEHLQFEWPECIASLDKKHNVAHISCDQGADERRHGLLCSVQSAQ